MYTFVKGAPNWVEPLNENFAEVAALAGAAVPASEKGAAGGVATLDSDGKLAQMPTAEDVGVAALVATTALEVGTDLDALTAPGTYLIPNNNVAATLLHAPAAKAGKVIVSDVTSTGTYIKQTVQVYNEADVYTRIKQTSGGWPDWTYHGVLSGSNANGSWMKHPDGTMECWGRSNWNAPASGGVTVSLPQLFAPGEKPVVTIQLPWTYTSATAYVGAVTNAVFGYGVFSGGAVAGALTVSWRAIGRWK